MKRFKAQHVFGDPLDETMVLFKDIVQVFDLHNFSQLTRSRDFQDSVHSRRPSQIGSAFINDYFVRNAIACDNLLKEASCSANVSALGEHKVEGMAVTINSPIQIGSFSFDLYTGLVDTT